MKKVISLFLAVAVLSVATTAMAAPTQSGSVSGNLRNGVTTFGATNSSSMPCFRTGDTITFTLGTLASGNELTVLTYKDGEAGSLSDSNVQYINQYTLDSTSKEISYTIRSQESGVYVLKANDSSGTVATFYYKIGSAEVSLVTKPGGVETLVTGTPGDPYLIKQDSSGKYSVGFLAKVTFNGTGADLEDIGAHPGFIVTNGTVTKNYGFGLGSNASSKTVAGLDATNLEIAGNYSVLYGLTIYNVTAGDEDDMQATAVLDTTSAQ